MTLPLGTDTSFYQKLVNWQRAFLAGVVFAYIRWGQRGMDPDYHDSYAKRSWLNCGDTPIYRGAYWVWDEEEGDGADEHMAGVLEVAREIGLDYYDGELPFVADLELEPVRWDELHRWLLLLEAWSGRRPDIYTGSWFYDRVDPLPGWLAEYNHWLTGYNDIGPDIWGPLEELDPFVTCWQDSPAWRVDWTATGYTDRDKWWAGEAHLKEYAEMGNTVVNADALRAWIDANEFEPEIEPPPAGEFKLQWPTPPAKVITQWYGINPQFYPGQKGHEGLDIRAVNGTPISAMADGTVYRVEDQDNGPYGKQVRVLHDHIDGPFKTIYAHFMSSEVDEGDEVQAGQVLGLADNTGNSSGAHLHITLKKEGDGSEWLGMGDIVNPVPYMPDLYPFARIEGHSGQGWITNTGGNFRTSPDLGNNLIYFIGTNEVLIPTGSFIDDWWEVVHGSNVGWFWNPGYKLMAF